MLLERLQITFSCKSPDIDETRNEKETVSEFVLRLAREKATHIANQYDDALIIGSDQAAECKNQILGKPGTHENAKKQLLLMSGKTVNFYTGLCLI